MRRSSAESTKAWPAFLGKLLAVDPASRDVTLTIPAKTGYLVLARLALSAVCRLTPLEPAEVADLKLAVTEAASGAIAAEAPKEEEPELVFSIELEEDSLVLELDREPAGPGLDDDSSEERELSRAIVEATVDQCDYRDGGVRLVKRFTSEDPSRVVGGPAQ